MCKIRSALFFCFTALHAQSGMYPLTLVASNGTNTDTSFQIARALADFCTKAGFASDL
jgi:hypothetical protein